MFDALSDEALIAVSRMQRETHQDVDHANVLAMRIAEMRAREAVQYDEPNLIALRNNEWKTGVSKP